MPTIIKTITKLLLLVGIAFTLSVAEAKKMPGIALAEADVFGDTQLSLNGSGDRTKLFIKLYKGGLYTETTGLKTAEDVIAADEPMAIRLKITSDLLTRSKMIKALKKGFKNSTGGDTTPLQPRIDQLIALMQDDIKDGDQFTLYYKPGTGTQLFKDKNLLGAIEGLAFKKALFGIWLSDKPAQASLKKAMLSGSADE